VNAAIADVRKLGRSLQAAVNVFTGIQTGDTEKAFAGLNQLPGTWQKVVLDINAAAVTPVVDAITSFVGGVESLATVPGFVLKFQSGDILGALAVWESVPDTLKPITEALNTFVTSVGSFGALAIGQVKSLFGPGGKVEAEAGAQQTGLGQRLVDSFTEVFTSPEWESVKTTGRATIDSIATALQDSFSAQAWAGVTAGVNTVKATFEGLQTIQWADIQAGLGWVSIGITAIRQEIDKFVKGFDVAGAAQTLGATLNTVLGSVTLLFAEVNKVRTEAWGALANTVTSIVTAGLHLATLTTATIDVGKITGLITAFTGGLAALASVTFDEEKLGGIGTALGDLVGTIATKLGEAVAEPGFGEEVAKSVMQATGAFAEGAIAMASGFAKALGNVDWGQFATSVQGFVDDFNTTIATALVDAVKTYDWGGLGTAIYDAIKQEILDAFANPKEAGQALQGAAETLIRRTPGVGPLAGVAMDIGGIISNLIRESLPLPKVPAALGGYAGITGPVAPPKLEVAKVEIPPIEPPNWDKYIPKLAWPEIVGFSWRSFIPDLKWEVPAFEWASFVPQLTWPTIPTINWRDYIPGFSWPTPPEISWDRYIPKLVWSGTTVPGGGGSGGGSGGFGGYQHGTSYFRGGLALVGEAGRELVSLPRGSRIYNNGDTEALLAAGAQPIRVAIGPVYIQGEQDIEALAWQVAKRIQSRMR
jgi:hypothetical protein